MAENEDVHALRRRGRRRLVGAIALVLLAVIVLPMVLDSEPPPPPPLSVRIPPEDDSAFAPRLTPKAPSSPALQPKSDAAAAAESREAKPEAGREAGRPSGKPDAVPERSAPALAAKGGDKAAPSGDVAAPRDRAQKGTAGAERFAVQIGAFRDAEKVREIAARLAAAGLPHYTEPVPVASGTAMRVRVGPYPSREAAGEALKTVQALGFATSKVVGPSL